MYFLRQKSVIVIIQYHIVEYALYFIPIKSDNLFHMQI